MMGKGHTTHVDRINLVPLCIHLINDMSSLECDCLISVSYLLPPRSDLVSPRLRIHFIPSSCVDNKSGGSKGVG
jgi:hypothetical protein